MHIMKFVELQLMFWNFELFLESVENQRELWLIWNARDGKPKKNERKAATARVSG